MQPGIQYRCVISCAKCGKHFRETPPFEDPFTAYRSALTGVRSMNTTKPHGIVFVCAPECEVANGA